MRARKRNSRSVLPLERRYIVVARSRTATDCCSPLHHGWPIVCHCRVVLGSFSMMGILRRQALRRVCVVRCAGRRPRCNRMSFFSGRTATQVGRFTARILMFAGAAIVVGHAQEAKKAAPAPVSYT